MTWKLGTRARDVWKPCDMNKTESQLKQRKRQNARGAQKRKENIAQGLCGCGKERENPRWKLCTRCREQARNRYYGVPNALPRHKRKKEEPIPENLTGVKRLIAADGLGNVNSWWIAYINLNGKPVIRRWAIGKHGELGAFKKARAQRQEWEKLKASLPGTRAWNKIQKAKEKAKKEKKKK